jgi:glyoxylase-like metal-dependent hydrolase (beta-lactamase superfamily II)
MSILAPTRQIPGVYHRKVGDIVVTAVSDGFNDGNLDAMTNVDIDVAKRILAENFRPARRTSVNAFVIHSGGRFALIDAGCGADRRATAGKLLTNLDALSIGPEDVSTVLMTHLHTDHALGLLDVNDHAVFTNAELVLHADEYRHWLDDALYNQADQRQKMYFEAARTALTPYADRLRHFEGGEVFPGVTAIPTPGHTPGHTSYLIASGGEQLMIWGDTVHVPEVQTAFPEAGVAFDTDSAMATASRKRMFERVVSDDLLVAGMHTHFPGFGRLTRNGSGGYRFVQEMWQHSL